MTILRELAVKATELKCFKSYQGFERLRSLNVVIGRNNSGKSALIDILEGLCLCDNDSQQQRTVSTSLYEFKVNFTGEVTKWYREQFRNTGHERGIQDAMGILKGHSIRWQAPPSGNDGNLVATVETELGIPDEHQRQFLRDQAAAVVRMIPNPFERFRFRRLVADRDIWREPETNNSQLKRNGSQATDLIQHFLLDSDRQRHIIEDLVLSGLNEIARPDMHFTRLSVRRMKPQQSAVNEWEVFLDEDSKGSIPLSASGSGIKTILLVLLNLHVAPLLLADGRGKFDNQNYSVFAFEEIENNLHPYLQRRLLRYIRDVADRGGTFIITTHSSAALDLFAADENVQLLRVTHEGKEAKVEQIDSYAKASSTIQSLGVRASDLLQANCLIWVEGPSDKAYVRRWIDLWTDGKIKEHSHYEFAIYGGALVAHTSFDDPDCGEAANDIDSDFVQALRVNRNSIIVMDSDKCDPSMPLKKRVQRIAIELHDGKGLAWITAGREIENYLTPNVLQDLFPKSAKSAPPGQFERVFDWIEKTTGCNFRERKVELAVRAVEQLTHKDQLKEILDLSERLQEICERVRDWNSIDG